MYKIGLFSKMNKVTIKTLRYYDEIGLLKPSHVDEYTGYRYYTSNQIPHLHRILMLKAIGFSINEIFKAMAEDTDADKMIKYLEGKEAEVSKNINEEQIKLSQIQSYLKILKKEVIFLNYNIITKELPEGIVASIRTVIPNYDTFNVLYPEMGQYMKEQNCKCAMPPYCFTMYHDGEYKETNIDVDLLSIQPNPIIETENEPQAPKKEHICCQQGESQKILAIIEEKDSQFSAGLSQLEEQVINWKANIAKKYSLAYRDTIYSPHSCQYGDYWRLSCKFC